MDLARSVQEVVEDVMLRMAQTAHRDTGSKRLCLAGGVALNCVANGRLLREGPFEEIWIQPAAGDAGGALGVAFALWHRYLGKPRVSAERRGAWVPRKDVPRSEAHIREASAEHELPAYADEMQGALLGPRFSDEEIAAWMRAEGISGEHLSPTELPAAIAQRLADGKVIGLFQGRMEFGPRALGCRSIIADAAVVGDAVGAESQDQVPGVLPGPSHRGCFANRWPTGSTWITRARTCSSSQAWRRRVAFRSRQAPKHCSAWRS